MSVRGNVHRPMFRQYFSYTITVPPCYGLKIDTLHVDFNVVRSSGRWANGFRRLLSICHNIRLYSKIVEWDLESRQGMLSATTCASTYISLIYYLNITIFIGTFCRCESVPSSIRSHEWSLGHIHEWIGSSYSKRLFCHIAEVHDILLEWVQNSIAQFLE